MPSIGDKMKNNCNSIREFRVDKTFLTKEEFKVVDNLIEAAKLIAKVYEQQIREGFYPKDATRQEIEKAASKNPEILSAYSVVERDRSGKLIAIPYHVKYKELLLPVADKLTSAAAVLTHHQDFNQALLIQAKSLLSGDYDKSQIAWLKVKPYILNIVIGPLEPNEDDLFFVKRSYLSWVGVMNKNITDRLDTLKKIVYSARRRQVLPTERVDLVDKAALRADETLILSGMMANYNYTACTLPNDFDILEKHGSEGWIFLPATRQNFDSRQFKLFELLFAPHFQGSFSKEDLYRGYLLMIAMHEIARVMLQYRFAIDRLRDHYPVFYDLAIETLGLKLAGSLLLKDVLSQHEMEAVLVMFLTRLFDGYAESLEKKTAAGPLVLGNAILLNSLLESGALQVTSKGISWPNFTKIFVAASDLANEMESILAEGKYADAAHYIEEHSSTTVFNRFSQALKTLLR